MLIVSVDWYTQTIICIKNNILYNDDYALWIKWTLTHLLFSGFDNN